MKRHLIITIHYRGSLLSKYYTHDPSEVLEIGNDLLVKGLREGRSIKEMRYLMMIWADAFHEKRTTGIKTSALDHQLFLGAFLGLMKLGEIQEDDRNGVIITKRKNLNLKRV
jgi:hypothetical protein